MSLIYNFTSFLEVAPTLSRLAGHADRLFQLHKVRTENDAHSLAYTPNIRGYFSIESVDVCIPESSKCLVRNLSFNVPFGINTLILGPSGSGKSSIFRCLFGLWRIKEGSVTLDEHYFVIPSESLLITGSLIDQITYPDQIEYDMTLGLKIHEILRKLDLLHLEDRIPYSDVRFVSFWTSALSHGEIQRLMLGRIFFHTPKYAFLDEATSKINGELEKSILQAFQQQGTTVVSISNNIRAKDLFQQIVTLDGSGGYTVERTLAES